MGGGVGKDVLAREARHVGGSGGMLPQKKFKIQGDAGATRSSFGTYELKAQLTSAHTRTNRACELWQPRKSARRTLRNNQHACFYDNA